jgi:hypothetical protein
LVIIEKLKENYSVLGVEAMAILYEEVEDAEENDGSKLDPLKLDSIIGSYGEVEKKIDEWEEMYKYEKTFKNYSVIFWYS